jgi:serine/threonine-protein kinase
MMAASETAPAREGDVLLGKYRVGSLIGVGGMGLVMSATHIALDEPVALKFLRASALGNADALERFGREARSAVRIKSEHVARIIDVAATDSGIPFIVMERLEGRDLADVIARSAPITVETAAAWVIQICSALAEAHDQGIIHRDLKPANLFLTQRADGSDSIKILDFGISKVLTADGRSEGKTGTSSLLGSPVYMAPEQMSAAKTIDARVDIWALGTILFELVTGTAPFDAPTLPEVCVRVLQEPPVRPCALRPDVPTDFEAIILRCLQKEPEHRFQTASDLALALCPFAPASSVFGVRSTPVPASMMGETICVTDPRKPTTDGAFASAHSVAPRRSRGVLWAAGGMLVAAAALTVLSLAGRVREVFPTVAAPQAAARAAIALPLDLARDPAAPAVPIEPRPMPSAAAPRVHASAAPSSGARPASKPVTGVHLFDERK